jgi:hypothetical protein
VLKKVTKFGQIGDFLPRFCCEELRAEISREARIQAQDNVHEGILLV